MKVTCQEFLRLQLDDLEQELEVCDKSGRTIGRYLPKAIYDRLANPAARADFTEAELEAAENQTGGRTTEEVLARLRAL